MRSYRILFEKILLYFDCSLIPLSILGGREMSLGKLLHETVRCCKLEWHLAKEVVLAYDDDCEAVFIVICYAFQHTVYWNIWPYMHNLDLRVTTSCKKRK